MSDPSDRPDGQAGILCSTIIPTIGRDTLDRAVHSVLAQELPGHDDDAFEIIVINDSGKPLVPAAWQANGRVRVIATNKRERCVARNTGAALARGRYLHFLDDDDWMVPGAFAALQQTAQAHPDVAWLYGSAKFIDPEGNHIGTLNFQRYGNCFTQTVAGAWIPLQASWIKAASFFAVGGFHPLIHVTQDLALSQQIALQGNFAYTDPVVVNILRGRSTAWGSSTNYDMGPHWVRWSRNHMLGQAGAYHRLLNSADTPFWHGRVLHAYLTTALYNLRKRSPLTAASRSLYGLATLATAGPRLFSSEFWKALRVHRVGRDFH